MDREKEVRLCAVIPCFNHARPLGGVLAGLERLGLRCIVVNDGSCGEDSAMIARLSEEHTGGVFISLPENRGKGAAVVAGLERASREGFTHVLQADADGQHSIEDVPSLIEAARANPGRVVSGLPVYDESIPKSRLYGRRITNFWTAVETCSLKLKESMCGLRVYPVAPALAAASRIRAMRMSFDIEIMVRLFWAGVDPVYVPVRVTYPVGGSSNFRMGADNAAISLVHAKLCLAMPWNMARRLRRRHGASGPAGNMSAAGIVGWASKPERRGLWGLKFMLRLYRFCGRRVFETALYPVIFFYWLSAGEARRCSRQWLAIAARQRRLAGLPEKPFGRAMNSFSHFYSFGLSVLDKVESWNGGLVLGRNVVYAPGAEECLKRDVNVRGKLILGSHLGDLEACRALSGGEGARAVNALVFTSNAVRFNEVMKSFAPDSQLNLIPVEEVGPDTAVMLKEKIDAGEIVAIVGDRVSPFRGRQGASRECTVPFMGRSAPFAQGPFILASLLACPVIVLFALREEKGLVIHARDFAPQVTLRRASRMADLEKYISRYAEILEEQAVRHPLDWFNFFDFFAPVDPGSGAGQGRAAP